jgi:hypothetical protein
VSPFPLSFPVRFPVTFLSPHTEPSYCAIVCEQAKPARAFRFYSFLLDAAAPSSLAQPLSAQHSRLVVRLFSHPFYLPFPRTQPA